MARQKWSWTPLQEERAETVTAVVDGLHPYWPLTLRQVYYQLVSSGEIKNNKSQYNMLSKLMKWMRIDDRLPWDALEDRTRTVTAKRGYSSLESFVYGELNGFMYGYSRCLVQGQDKYIEVWTEKDALLRIFHEVVYPYCIRAVVCRGYSSVTFIADYYNRAIKAIGKGQLPVVLYFGDLDPSGVQMLEATIETLEDELDLYGVEFRRIGLNPVHISLYDLPSDPNAAKTSDPRYKKYVEEYGTVAVELDAVHPAQLQKMIRSAVEAELDMDLFEDQQDQEDTDHERLDSLRNTIMDVVHEQIEIADI